MGTGLGHMIGERGNGRRSPRLPLWGAGIALSLLIGAGAATLAAKVVADDAQRRFEAIGGVCLIRGFAHAMK